MTLQEVCDQYYKKVYLRCLHSLNFNQYAAEEVTQEVFSVLCKRWTEVENHPNIQGWLRKTATNKLKKAKVRYAFRSGLVSINADNFREPLVEKDMLEQIVSGYLEEDMGQYIGEVYTRLNEKERTLLGYMQKKMKYAEIAKRMNTTEGAVSMAAVRLSRKIREIVREIVENVL